MDRARETDDTKEPDDLTKESRYSLDARDPRPAFRATVAAIGRELFRLERAGPTLAIEWDCRNERQ